jgi:hypothetical protein
LSERPDTIQGSDLAPDQCEAFAEKFGRMQAELGCVLAQMQERQLLQHDKLYGLTQAAFDKLYHLTTRVHCLGCLGVGLQRSLADTPPPARIIRIV